MTGILAPLLVGCAQSGLNKEPAQVSPWLPADAETLSSQPNDPSASWYREYTRTLPVGPPDSNGALQGRTFGLGNRGSIHKASQSRTADPGPVFVAHNE